jgi:hypothetical protein
MAKSRWWKWTSPVYVAQTITAVAGISVILVDEGIALHWRALTTALLAAALLLSIVVTGRAEADAERNENYLQTLVLSMQLPYFVIEDVSRKIRISAEGGGWAFLRQENFREATVYDFGGAGSATGRLVIRDEEFKRLWLLDDPARDTAINMRLFGGEFSVQDSEEELMGSAIQFFISVGASGPHWISVRQVPEGTRTWEVSRTQGGALLASVIFTSDVWKELLQMPPLPRYALLSEQVEASLHCARAAGSA